MEKLDPLQTFVEVVRAGSFTAAAKALSMPRSTVSLHIRSLEAALATRLLKRSTRSLSLTNDGQLLFSRAEDGLRSLIAAMDMVRGDPGNLSGLIRLTAPADFPAETLATAMTGFRQTHPAVRFDIRLTNAALDMIADDVDIALRIGRRGDLDRVEHKLAPVRWQFCASKDWVGRNGTPGTLGEIAEFISPSPDLRAFLERFVLAGRKLPTGVITADNQLMIRDLAIAGSGAALLPSGVCQTPIAAGRLLPLLPDIPTEAPSLNLTFPSRADITPRVRAFADALALQFR
nr:LysR family transcriptional regulator [Marinicella sp. W31]MDC2875540.1 LysR family transcriptional regulator [Marinicella sp. W31]